MSMPSSALSSHGEKQQQQQQLVCVTGAGGFVGAWVVKELLLRGYRVSGTARDPADRKNEHLLSLEGAKERLALCRADVLDYGSLRAAFAGCHGVFHVASPVSDDPVRACSASSHTLVSAIPVQCRHAVIERTCLRDLVPVAVEGTRNVINAAADAGVRRVVFTSSYGAVHMDPNRSPDAVVDETFWSDYEFCKQTGNMYCCAKMMAEKAAMEEAARRGLELAVVVPCVTVGPMLQPTLNASNRRVAIYLTGARTFYPNAVAAYVDVRDVARAHVLVYERPDARGRRFLCVDAVLHRQRFLQLLRDLCPDYPIPTKCKDDGKPMAKPYRFSNQRLRDLGLEFTPLKESLYETVVSLQRNGHLPLHGPVPKRSRL